MTTLGNLGAAGGFYAASGAIPPSVLARFEMLGAASAEVSTAKQFCVDGVQSALPEPATGVLFLLAFAGIRGAMRTRLPATGRFQ